MFADVRPNVDTEASLWMMVSNGSPIMHELNAKLAKLTSIQVSAAYLSLDVHDSLALDVGLRLGSPETVAQLVAKIQARMNDAAVAPQIARYFDQLDVTPDGSDLIVSVAASKDQLAQLIARAKTLGAAAHGHVSVSMSHRAHGVPVSSAARGSQYVRKP